MTDQSDQSDDDRDGRQPARAPDGRRRSAWSRRIAAAVLITFAAFVIFNAVTVLAMLYSSAAHGGGPFGN